MGRADTGAGRHRWITVLALAAALLAGCGTEPPPGGAPGAGLSGAAEQAPATDTGVAPAGRCWLVPDEGSNSPLRVALPGGQITAQVPTGVFPHDATATPGGVTFVANEFARSVPAAGATELLVSVQAPR